MIRDDPRGGKFRDSEIRRISTLSENSEARARAVYDKINIRLNISLRSGWQPRDA
jgi:hypothetical protein